jgi:3-oxoacyl-[acyl-carrier protein] reductase
VKILFFNSEVRPFLEGKRVIITGGSKGIGAALAVILSAELNEVIIIGRNKNTLQEVAKSASNIDYLVADVSLDSGICNVIQYISNKDVKIDFLVNCAAVFNFKSLVDVTSKDFDNSMNTIVKAPLMLTNALLNNNLFSSEKSRVLMISSSAIRQSYEPNIGLLLAPKAALYAIQNVMKQEYEGKLLIGSVYPGTVNTQVCQRAKSGIDPFPKELRKKICLAYDEEKILSPNESATFLKWVLCNTTDEQFINPVKALKPGSQIVNDNYEWDIRNCECYSGCPVTAGTMLRGLLPGSSVETSKGPSVSP